MNVNTYSKLNIWSHTLKINMFCWTRWSPEESSMLEWVSIGTIFFSHFVFFEDSTIGRPQVLITYSKFSFRLRSIRCMSLYKLFLKQIGKIRFPAFLNPNQSFFHHKKWSRFFWKAYSQKNLVWRLEEKNNLVVFEDWNFQWFFCSPRLADFPLLSSVTFQKALYLCLLASKP